MSPTGTGAVSSSSAAGGSARGGTQAYTVTSYMAKKQVDSDGIDIFGFELMKQDLIRRFEEHPSHSEELDSETQKDLLAEDRTELIKRRNMLRAGIMKAVVRELGFPLSNRWSECRSWMHSLS
jgi:hypothetical protein